MKKLFFNFAMLSMVVFPLAVSAKDIDKNVKEFTLTEDLKEGIVVKDGANATLDLAGFSVTNNGKEHTIYVEKGATLTIKGNGNVINDATGYASLINDGTVVVNGGNFKRNDAAGTKGFYVILNHGKMTIENGTVTGKGGISSLIDNGWYTPEQNVDKTMAELIINGGNFELTENDKYIKNDDYGIMTINGGTFNMVKPSSAIIGAMGYFSGKELVTINGGNFNYTGTNYAVWDYDWNTIGEDDKSTTVINGGIFNITNEKGKVSNVKIGGTGEAGENVSKEYPVIGDENQTIVAKKSELTPKIEVKGVKESDVNKDELTLINTAISNKYVIAKLYNIDLFNAFNGLKVEQVTDAEKEIAITITIPTDMEKVKDGYNRKYYVVRVHNGKTDILDTVVNEDGTLTFKTDKFSTYSLVYADSANSTPSQPSTVDNNIENPKTGDNIVAYLFVAGASVAGAVALRKSYKKEN